MSAGGHREQYRDREKSQHDPRFHGAVAVVGVPTEHLEPVAEDGGENTEKADERRKGELDPDSGSRWDLRHLAVPPLAPDLHSPAP